MKNKKYKIKDLPKNFNLVGCKLGGRVIISGWNKGFWLKENLSSIQIFPTFFKDFEQIKDWKVEVPPEREIEIFIYKKLT